MPGAAADAPGPVARLGGRAVAFRDPAPGGDSRLAGVTSYLGANLGGLPYPFLASLAVALGTYVSGSAVELVARGRPAQAVGG